MVDAVVQWLPPDLIQPKADQALRCGVHERAVLVHVHDKERERGVVRHRFRLPTTPVGTQRIAFEPDHLLTGVDLRCLHQIAR